jgi:hypothetical protein
MKTQTKIQTTKRTAVSVVSIEGHPVPTSSPSKVLGGLLFIKKHYQGCYRISNGGEIFGQIKKDGRKWIAEIRETDCGDIKRYAGIWNTKKEAIEEVIFILNT